MSNGVSRYGSGGFSPRFVVRRSDGKPCRKDARYMVLDGSGADPHALLALHVYAGSVRAENSELADDIMRMIGLTGGASGRVVTGGNWPPELAQHENAE